jgi:hypothetical protein
LFTLDKMYMQFTAFAAANAAQDSEDTIKHADHVTQAYRTLKLDVLGADRDLSRGPSWDLAENSFVLAYSDMFTAIMRERAATITVSYAPFYGAGLGAVLIRDTTYGEDNFERWYAGNHWAGRLEQLGVPTATARLPTILSGNFEQQKAAYVRSICLFEMKDTHLREKLDALYTFVEKLPTWDKALSDWEKIAADAAPSTKTAS